MTFLDILTSLNLCSPSWQWVHSVLNHGNSKVCPITCWYYQRIRYIISCKTEAEMMLCRTARHKEPAFANTHIALIEYVPWKCALSSVIILNAQCITSRSHIMKNCSSIIQIPWKVGVIRTLFLVIIWWPIAYMLSHFLCNVQKTVVIIFLEFRVQQNEISTQFELRRYSVMRWAPNWPQNGLQMTRQCTQCPAKGTLYRRAFWQLYLKVNLPGVL